MFLCVILKVRIGNDDYGIICTSAIKSIIRYGPVTDVTGI
jgi:hypothetical protein